MNLTVKTDIHSHTYLRMPHISLLNQSENFLRYYLRWSQKETNYEYYPKRIYRNQL